MHLHLEPLPELPAEFAQASALGGTIEGAVQGRVQHHGNVVIGIRSMIPSGARSVEPYLAQAVSVERLQLRLDLGEHRVAELASLTVGSCRVADHA